MMAWVDNGRAENPCMVRFWGLNSTLVLQLDPSGDLKNQNHGP